MRNILFVDDDKHIRELMSVFFSRGDILFKVAADGAQALALLECGTQVNLLITDIVMPGEIDGFELAHRAKRMRPDLSVIYISGYVREIPSGAAGAGCDPMIKKPFRFEQLETEMERVFAGNSPR
jgi:CheY-like chemotaxis protein